MATPRMTVTTQLVLKALLANESGEMCGLDIARMTGMYTGTVYAILVRLQTVGWLRSRWEQIDPVVEGRPARRYYAVTDSGRTAAAEALAQAQAAAHARTQ